MPPKGWGDAELDAKMRKAERKEVKKEREAAISEEKEMDAVQRADVHTQLVDSGFPPLLAEELLNRLSVTKLKWAYCPDCRRKVQVDAIDANAQMKALEMALGYLIGKPKERKELDIIIAQKPLSEMSLNEKQSYLHELERRELT